MRLKTSVSLLPRNSRSFWRENLRTSSFWMIFVNMGTTMKRSCLASFGRHLMTLTSTLMRLKRSTLNSSTNLTINSSSNQPSSKPHSQISTKRLRTLNVTSLIFKTITQDTSWDCSKFINLMFQRSSSTQWMIKMIIVQLISLSDSSLVLWISSILSRRISLSIISCLTIKSSIEDKQVCRRKGTHF